MKMMSSLLPPSPPTAIEGTVENAQYTILLLPSFANGHWTINDLGSIDAESSFDCILPLSNENVMPGNGDVVCIVLNNPRMLVLSPNWGMLVHEEGHDVTATVAAPPCTATINIYYDEFE